MYVCMYVYVYLYVFMRSFVCIYVYLYMQSLSLPDKFLRSKLISYRLISIITMQRGPPIARDQLLRVYTVLHTGLVQSNQVGGVNWKLLATPLGRDDLMLLVRTMIMIFHSMIFLNNCFETILNRSFINSMLYE